MFKNKAFLVKMIEEPKKSSEPQPTPAEIDAAKHARADAQVEAGVNIVIGTSLVIGIYMAADTLRKIAVHTATTKIK